VEEGLGADAGKIEGGGKHGIKVEERERGDQEVGFVNPAEMHRACSSSAQQVDSGHDHSEEEHNCQCRQVSLHLSYSDRAALLTACLTTQPTCPGSQSRPRAGAASG